MEQLRQEIFEKVQQIRRLSQLRNNVVNKLKDKGEKLDCKLFKLKEDVRDLHIEYEILVDAILLRDMQRLDEPI